MAIESKIPILHHIKHHIKTHSKAHRYAYYILITLFVFLLLMFLIKPSQYLCKEVPVEETIATLQEEPYLAIEPGKVPLKFTDRAYLFDGYNNGDYSTIIKVFVKNTDADQGTFKVQAVISNSTNIYTKEDEQVIKAGEEKIFYFEQIEGRNNIPMNFTHGVTPSSKDKSVQITKYRNVTVTKVVTVTKRVCF
ncbi:MAG: hypothetical protein AABW84_00810 [Nanoarchaeota archaeon]